MRKKGIVTLAAAAAVMLLGISCPVQAAGNVMTNFAGSYDENLDILNSFYAAAAMYDDSLIVISDVEVVHPDAYIIALVNLVTEDVIYQWDDEEEYTDGGFVGLWTTALDGVDTGNYANWVGGYEGEPVWLHYIDPDKNEQVIEAEIVDYEAASDELFWLYLTWEESLSASDFYIPDGGSGISVGIIVNEDGDYVGFLGPDGGFYTMFLSEDFYQDDSTEEETGTDDGSDEEGADGNTGTGDGSDSNTDQGQDSGSYGDSSKGREPIDLDSESDPTPAIDQNAVILIVVGVVILVGIIAVVVILRKKNTGKGSTPTPAPTPTPGQQDSYDEIPETGPFIPGGQQQTEPVKPVTPPHRTVTLKLYAEGGVMDGRRYEITGQTITFGRDPSNTICYPSNTVGVSRRHCKLFWNNGTLMLMDCGSTSGTFVQGKGQLTPNAPVALTAGATFYLGEKRNAFTLREETN